MTNNKQKGKRVEREAATKLSKLTDLNWKRTVFSGAMTKHRDNDVYKGDIHISNENKTDINGFDWEDIVVEVKGRVPSIKLQELFSENSTMAKHIKQAQRQSNEWVLMVKVNYEGWFAFGNIGELEMKETFQQSKGLYNDGTITILRL